MMKGRIALLLSVLAVALAQVQGERLIWADEFDNLDSGKWTHFVTGWDGGNSELQYYRDNRKNSFTRNGVLFIRPTETAEEVPDLQNGRVGEPGCSMEPCVITGGFDIVPPYFSARLMTRDTFSMQYGRVEIRAKMPTGDWLWPAIWMLPTDNSFGGWPRSGEIDIVEVRGNPDLRSPDGVNHGITEVGSALHYGPSWDYKAMVNRLIQAPAGRNWGDDFHNYELIWNKDLMKFLVDGQVIQEINIPNGGGMAEVGHIYTDMYKADKSAPFNQRFHFILNVAIGGGFFPADWKSAGRPRPWWGGDNRRQLWNSRGAWQHTWGSPDQHSLQIDYIRVYQ